MQLLSEQKRTGHSTSVHSVCECVRRLRVLLAGLESSECTLLHLLLSFASIITTSFTMVSDALDSDSPCNPHACAIQTCMQKTLNQEKCSHLIDDLYRCCAKFYNQKGAKADTESCPILPVVRRKLKAIGEQDRLQVE